MKTLIIAEAGVNHNGDISLAKKLIDAAVYAGADVVKFQTFTTANVLTPNAPKADYQIQAAANQESQYDMLKKLELSPIQHEELIAYAAKQNIEFLSTAFDLDSIDFLARLGLTRFKIPSGEITNLPYLRRVGQYGKPIILSTGMATLGEIESALKILNDSGTSHANMSVLHCNTEYPTPMKDVNLSAMNTIRNAFKVNVGYSDHTKGIEVSIAAVALGATIIEKHLTLDCALPGPDHKASIEPNEFRAMTSAIRNIELALGNGIKSPSPSESPNIVIARRSLVAAKPIQAGEIFTSDNLISKRPGIGISPMRWDEILGKKSPQDFLVDELIEL